MLGKDDLGDDDREDNNQGVYINQDDKGNDGNHGKNVGDAQQVMTRSMTATKENNTWASTVWPTRATTTRPTTIRTTTTRTTMTRSMTTD